MKNEIEKYLETGWLENCVILRELIQMNLETPNSYASWTVSLIKTAAITLEFSLREEVGYEKEIQMLELLITNNFTDTFKRAKKRAKEIEPTI